MSRVQRTEDDGGHHLVAAPKTDAGRRTLVLPVALVPEIEAHLAEWTPPEPDAPVFVGPRGGPLRIATWKREWARVRRELDLEGVRLHDLRHLAGTLAAATGASSKELMHRLGHASPRAARSATSTPRPRGTKRSPTASTASSKRHSATAIRTRT